MNWGSLFFSAEGRIGQKDFWLAAVILFVFSIVIHAAAVVGTLLWFLSAYCWICIYSKRLHDIGRSGWLQVLPFVLGWMLMTVGFVFGVGSLLGLIFSGLPHFLGGIALGGMAIGFGALCLGGLMHLILLLWLGLSPGQVGPNRYGPEPGAPAFNPAV
jgi:uncharacterized membrane protein YhaH (DUF805 family)